MTEVIAEMVASVLRIDASVGQQLAEGDPLVLLESMKMEIPVFAPREGTVAQILVSEGDTVQEGDVLAVLG